ncbi:MAG: lytic transglycosylase [Paracoccaceae bacterium]
MIKSFRFLAILAVLAACGGPSNAPPSRLDNACSIVAERPGWHKEMRRVERKWGVPVHVQMATIYQESKFDGDARTPYRFALGVIPMGRQSSAYGFSQAIDSTWEEYQRDEGGRGAKRDRFDDAVDFMGWYMDGSEKRLGISKFDVRNQYLAYHEGRSGYARGSYRRKSWLMRISDDVARRADMYQFQLISCGKN